ncbi:MAG: L,D-transpeptidase [Rhodobacteraceae bacterium]|nr:L,D-transpeptidase [Paracoccaceae bacterium]
MTRIVYSRRGALLGLAATLATPSVLRAQTPGTVDQAFPSRDAEPPIADTYVARRNASAFVGQNWQDHFEKIGVGCILADTVSRAVHYWNPQGEYRLYPSSVPMTDELTRRGYTQIVRKKVGPTWTPTKNMRERDPTLPEFMPAGPGNPLGTHAMYLTWPAYLIHGTHDTRKIGRQSSSGCIGLYNPHIEELFALTAIGTQVRVL